MDGGHANVIEKILSETDNPVSTLFVLFCGSRTFDNPVSNIKILGGRKTTNILTSVFDFAICIIFGAPKHVTSNSVDWL